MAKTRRLRKVKFRMEKEMTTFTTQDRQDAQRPPLTDEQIYEIYLKVETDVMASKGKMFPIEIARAIERAHGIGQ